MRQRRLFWLVSGVLMVLASWMIFRRLDRQTAVTPLSSPAAGGGASTASTPAMLPPGFTLVNNRAAVAAAAAHTTQFQRRVSNTAVRLDDLMRNERAVLLRNAMIDTTLPLDLAIPPQFRASSNTASYIVQSRGVINDAFRELLRSAGASIVAYIPNNALLVRTKAESVAALQASPIVSAVLPFEPFYKVDARLFDERFAQYRVLSFPGEEAALAQAVEGAGATVLSRERTALGTILTVQGNDVDVATLARIDELEVIEPKVLRQAATAMVRAAIGVSVDGTNAANYMGLTGTNIMVAIPDTGLDTNHVDLLPRAVVDLPGTALDPDGHGTLAAGIIASSGKHSTNLSAAGSPAGSDFRGMAPAARLYGMRAVGTDDQSDAYLQEQASSTNALISNNSWGYPGAFDYDLAAASYDAAVRDALPSITGSQPLLFVFAAGNSGFGSDNGQGGEAGSIVSPATSKNSITVGASELPKSITNEVLQTNFIVLGSNSFTITTNQPWAGETDTSDEVAAFSGRGNVGAGTEGERGRFKPDVVAPGVFVVSTRSTDWNQYAYYNPTNFQANRFRFQQIEARQQKDFSIFIPATAVGFVLQVLPNSLTPLPLPNLQIYVRQAARPTTIVYDVLATNFVAIPPAVPLTPVDTTWFYSVRNPGTNTVSVDIRTVIATTNDFGNQYTVLSNLNETLDTNHLYRYESGTSMAAPAVSGMLALMEEFFEQRLQPLYNPTNRPSPALLKALVINGARSLGTLYDFSANSVINYQGWGIVNLTNSLPSSLSNLVSQTSTNSTLVFYDQHPTNALTTGQSRTRQIKMSEEARIQPLRVTLVWTDPPGNPVAGPKLVNDLNLVVTNLDSGEVYFGNDIPVGEDFTQASTTTNGLLNVDFVNNVENVFLNSPLGTNYAIAVVARRVNVNAVTAQTNGIAQDYALVISSGDGGSVTNGFTVTDTGINTFTNEPYVTIVSSNGVPLLNQHIGANHALITTTNGTTNQWHFFVYTNATTFTNVAFVTFLPPDLSVPRMGTREVTEENATRFEADIDLYVSSDSSLTNLNPLAIAASRKSLHRGGTEDVILSNAAPDQVFFVGVKSEDQMGAEFGFLAVSSELPFSVLDAEGNQHLRGLTLPVVIPDGAPSKPGGALVFALAAYPMSVRKAVVTNTITHQGMGDLLGDLTHGQQFAVLNNHRPGLVGGAVPQTFVYDDQGGIAGAQTTDGPGSLRSFVGEEGAGVWMLTMVDNSLNQTGRVDGLDIRLEPSNDDVGTTNVITIRSQQFYFDSIDVPAEATNLTVVIDSATQIGPLELYIRKDEFPTRTQYDKFALIYPPGGTLSVSLFDVPPLTTGRYYIGIFNPNLSDQTVKYAKLLYLAANPASAGGFVNLGTTPLIDDAVSRATTQVTNNQKIARAEVGVIIDHPRIADLALTLISPGGKRVLLSEDRGGLSTNGYGSIVLTTNVSPRAANGGPAADTNIIAVGANSGTLRVGYDFHPIPDVMQVIYDGRVIFDTGPVTGSNNFTVNFGPGASTDLTIVMNPGNNSNTNTIWDYLATVVSGAGSYAIFTEDTTKTGTPIKFAGPPFAPNPAAVNIWGSDFEVAATNYPAGTVVDAWSVVTNSVDVVADGAFANTGQKYLQLGTALIGQTVPTVAGRRYTMTYSYRKAPDTNVNNLVQDGSFELFDVGFYNVPSTLGAWVVTTNALTQNNSVEVDNGLLGPPFWNGAHGVKSVDLDGNVGQAGAIYQDVATTVGRVYSLRYALAGNYVNAPAVKTNRIFIGGVNYGTNTFDTTGHDAANMGWVYYETNFTATAAKTRILFESLTGSGWGPVIDDVSVTEVPKALVSLNNLTNLVVAGASWRTNTISLIAAGGTVTLSAQGLEAGVALDSFTLKEQQGSIYYLPESSLSSLIGDNAQGTWTLEVWDTRVGATNLVTPKIVGWKLDLAFENTVPLARPLTHAVVVTNSISAGAIQYFYVDVPLWASFATNTLTSPSTNLNLWFNTNGLPRQNVPTDVLLLSGPGTKTLSGSSTPPIAAGNRYFLAVANTGATTTYAISVEFDVTELTNAVSLVATQAAFRPRYYSFDVSTNAVAVIFETFNANGNVDMVVRHGTPLPDLNNNDYKSANTGTNNELIVVITNSAPVPLAPGRWYVGVFNQDSTAVNYTVRATELASIDPVIIAINPSTNSLCLTWTSVPGFSYYVVGKVNLEDLLWVPVSPTIVAVATNTTYCIPLPTPYQFFDIRVGTAPQPPDPDQPVGIPPNSIAYFAVPVSDWPYAATNTLVSSSLPVDLLFNQNGLPTGTAPGDVKLLGNTNNGVFTLTTNSTPVLRTNRTYYLGLRNTNSVSVLAFLQVEFNFTLLTNGVSLSDTLLSSIPRYFSLVVPTNSAAAFFQIYNLNANSDLVIREDGFGIPTLTSHDYASTNLGRINDGILLTTNSAPFPLTAKKWNISVYNRTQLPAGYTVRASATTNANPDIIHSEVVSNALCLTWFSIPGLNYYVAGKVNLTDAEWTPASPTIVAEDFTTTYCIPLPTPFQFFEIRVGKAPTATIPDPDEPFIIEPNEIVYFVVPVSDWPYAATNTVVTSSLPVDLLFNQDTLPTGTKPGDLILLTNTLGGVSTVLTNGNPPLLTNRNYYLGLRNNNPAPVTASLRVEFNSTLLTNGVAFSGILDSPIPRYFSFAVPPGSATADFELYNLTTNADLVIREASFPSLTTFDYGSFNLGTTNELITVTTTSLPRPLTANFWNLSVYNRTNGVAGYTVRATATNSNPVIVDTEISSTNLCLTWTSIPGTNYYVVGKVELTDTNWVPVSPAITATSNLTTYCVTLPNSNHFFDVLIGTPPVIPPTSGPPVIIDIEISSTNLCLTWTSIPGTNYYVVGKVELTDTNWVPVSPVITATSTQTTYCVTLPNTNHFFDVIVTTTPVTPPPSGPPVITDIQVSSTNVCLTWTSIPGTNYYVVGKVELTDTNWVPVSPVITATGTQTTYCVTRPNSNHFFDVIVTNTTVTPPPSGPPVIKDIQVSSTNMCLTWTSIPGTNYYVVGKAELTDTAWVPVSPVITATSTQTTYCVTLPNTNHFFDVIVTTPPVVPPPGPPVVTGIQISSTNLCLTWTSIPGTNYYVVGKVDLTNTTWVPVSPVITATGTQTTYCVTLPNTNHFFDVIVTNAPVTPPPSGPPVVTGIQISTTNLCLTWTSIPGTNYYVVGKVDLTDTNWVPVSPVITATGTQTTYCVTLPNTNHFFDVIVTVPPVIPTAPPSPPVVTGIQINSTNLCLTWSSVSGTNYYVVGKVELTNTTWVPVSPVITATSTQTTYCVTLPNTNHFFDIVVGSLPAGPPAISSIVLNTNGAFVLNWTAPVTTRFQVQWTPTIPTNIWNTFSNIVTPGATNAGLGVFSFKDDGSQSGGLGQQRFYQLLKLP